MAETDQRRSSASTPQTGIVGLNTDTNCAMIGSEMVHEVHFGLSESPPETSGVLFCALGWKPANAGEPLALQHASIDRACHVMRCHFNEVAARLAVLKNVVAATNNAFNQHIHTQATEQKARESIRKTER